MKRIHNILNQDEAVSPVIGEIMMVAITVILAAGIAAFAFGMDSPDMAPTSQLKFTADSSDGLTVKNIGGDPLVLSDLEITVKYGNGTDIYNNVNMSAFLEGNESLTVGNWYTNHSIADNFTSGEVIKVTILDVPSGQIMVDGLKVVSA